MVTKWKMQITSTCVCVLDENDNDASTLLVVGRCGVMSISLYSSSQPLAVCSQRQKIRHVERRVRFVVNCSHCVDYD